MSDEGAVGEARCATADRPAIERTTSPLQTELKKLRRAINIYDASHANVLIAPFPAILSSLDFLKLQFLPEAWQFPLRLLLILSLLLLAAAGIRRLGRFWGRKIAQRRPALVQRLRRILEREGLFMELVNEIEAQAIAQPEPADIAGKLQRLFRPGTSARHLVQRLIDRSMRILRQTGFECFGYSTPNPFSVYEVKYALYQLLVEELSPPAVAVHETTS